MVPDNSYCFFLLLSSESIKEERVQCRHILGASGSKQEYSSKVQTKDWRLLMHDKAQKSSLLISVGS